MAHSICTPDSEESLRYFQRLWRTLLAPNIDPRSKLERLFKQETAEFDMEYGYLTSIDLENETERIEVANGTHETLSPGTAIPLSETYCRKTIADPEGTMAISDALAEGWENDPAYREYELGSYLGTTVSVEDRLYGTLCFADTDARADTIRDREKALIEMHAKWVEYQSTHWDGPSTWRGRIDPIEGRAVSADAIDTMMDALTSRARRNILMTLLDDTETSVATLEQETDQEATRLYHHHLPKLAAAGYIAWDEDSDTVSRGETFTEVEPLVQLLNEYNTAFPK